MRVIKRSCFETTLPKIHFPLSGSVRLNLVLRNAGWVVTVLVALGGVLLAALGARNMVQVAMVVDWQTASELDTAGFNLYRSESLQGPFIKINSTLIQPSSDPLAGGSYSYTDSPVQPGHTYYYQLEEVNVDGATARHGPVMGRAQTSGGLELAVGGLLLAASLLSGIRLARRSRLAS
jgi:hypothetical protein